MKIKKYLIYEEPINPTSEGVYYGSTPIEEQALKIVENGKVQGKRYFIKVEYDDGTTMYY